MTIWKSILGYDNKYWVSDEGQVISLGNDKTRKTKILKAGKDRKGYLHIMLCKDGKKKTCYIHRLVAEAFIPNPNNLPQINHKNEEDKTDNRTEALEWCDAKYNINYGTRNQRVAEKKTNGKDSKPVLQFDLQGNFIKEYPSLSEVKRQLGYSTGFLCDCCKGKYNHQGYNSIWKYKEERAA